jgi:broad specificity phosphatase PhoE
MLELILLRHGHTLKGPHKLAAVLSPLGQQQADLAGAHCRVAWPHLSALYSSDLSRTLQSAAYLPLPAIPEPRLREYQTWSQVNHPLEADQLHQPAESWEGFRKRVLGCLDDLAQAHPHQTILVVTHGGVFDLLLSCALKFGGNAGLVTMTHHCAFSHLCYHPGAGSPSEQVQVVYHNRTDHLPPDLLTG